MVAAAWDHAGPGTLFAGGHLPSLSLAVMAAFRPVIWRRREMAVPAGLIAQTAVPYLLSGKISRLVLTQKLLFGPHWLSDFPL